MNFDDLLSDDTPETSTPEAPKPTKSESGSKNKPAPSGVRVEKIEVEAVVCGVLQRVTLTGCAPDQVGAYLKALDPTCKTRDDFPSKSFGGKKETKSAILMVITLRASDSGLFIDLVCQGESDVSVSVGKKKAPDFRNELAALGKISAANLAKIDDAIANKGQTTIIFHETDGIQVNYWTTDDGKAFYESLSTTTTENNTHEKG